MNQTMELILTDGQTLKLEVIEGQPTHRLNLWLVDSEENQLLSSTHLLAVPHLAKEEVNNNEFLKEVVSEGKYSLFEEITSDINCYGGAKYAVEEIFDDVKDWNNPRNQTRLKGLVHLAIHEG